LSGAIPKASGFAGGYLLPSSFLSHAGGRRGSRNVNSVKIAYFALDRGGPFEHWVKIKNRQHAATTRVIAPRFMPFSSLYNGYFVPLFRPENENRRS
jgi:hypothetical protein